MKFSFPSSAKVCYFAISTAFVVLLSCTRLCADTYCNSDTTLDNVTTGDTSTSYYVGSGTSDVDLLLENGSSLTSYYFVVGYDDDNDPSNDSFSTVTVDASSLEANLALVVGERGYSNTLTIQNGSTLTSNYTSLVNDSDYIGVGYATSSTWSTNTAGSYGYGNIVTVTGKGSTWTMENDLTGSSHYLYVGYIGCANELNISAGGAVDVGNVIIGYGADDNTGYNGDGACGNGNSVTVDGATSKLDVYLGLGVGYLGSDNTLTISNGATVTANFLVVGEGQCVSGSYSSNKDNGYGYGNSVTVKGAGSKLTVTDVTHIGSYGYHNTMEISDSGEVVCTQSLMIGTGDATYGTGGYNSVTVTGSGSKLTMGYNLFIGLNGDYNCLKIESGADATTAGFCSIGYNSCASGNSATVTGAGSSWVISGDLSIGTSGNGANILYVLNDSLVQVGGTISIASNNYIFLADGYLAVAGDYTTGGAKNGELAELLSGMQTYAIGGYKAATTSNTYLVYISNSIASVYEAALGYDNLEGYTIFSSSLITVPEPATYALFGGIGALALAFHRRRALRS